MRWKRKTPPVVRALQPSDGGKLNSNVTMRPSPRPPKPHRVISLLGCAASQDKALLRGTGGTAPVPDAEAE